MAKREFVTVSKDVRTFVPSDWKDASGVAEKDALTFKFIPLSVRQLAAFQDNSSRMSIQSSTLLLGNASVNIDIFRTVVTGWENYVVDKKPVEFAKDGMGLVKEELIEGLPLDIIEEVANHIVKISKFPEEAKGK